MILVAMRTGMRMGELLGLPWADVDLSAGRILVRRSYVRRHFGLPKSRKSREIGLGDDVIETLRAHRHERGVLRCRGEAPHGGAPGVAAQAAAQARRAARDRVARVAP
jgi:integrase